MSSDEDDGFWGDRDRGGGYHEVMGSVNNLPGREQAAYDARADDQGFGLPRPAGYIEPADEGMNSNWWNSGAVAGDESSSHKKKAKKKEAQRVGAKAEEEKSEDWEVPLVSLESPSPLVWVMCVALIMTITFVCVTIQVGGYEEMNENPMWGPDESTILQMGAKYGPLIVDGEWWRLFTAIFLQNGLIFYCLSMVLLFICRNVERQSGWWRAVFVFLLSGVYGYILSSLFVPELISCGTTGALCGYIGLMLSDLIAKWRGVSWPGLRLLGILVLIAILIVFGLSPYVDNFLHIGGLIMGFLAALMLMPSLNFGRCEGIVHSILAFLAFPLMSTLFMICLVMLFRQVNAEDSWCSWCVKATCVNISGWCK